MSLLKILIWLDVQTLRAITLGKSKPHETISSAAWDLKLDGKWQGKVFVPVINLLFRPWGKDHCRKAWEWQYQIYANENNPDGTPK